MSETEVYVEAGKKKVFAGALDWPGWTRGGRDEHEALAALGAYAPRYAVVTERALHELTSHRSHLRRRRTACRLGRHRLRSALRHPRS
jgi:hypothetical protein